MVVRRHGPVRAAGGRAFVETDEDLVCFVADLEAQKRSKYTVKHYALSVRLFHDWLRTELGHQGPLRKASQSDLKAYQIWLSTQKRYSKNSIYFSIKSLQAFYRFLQLDTADSMKPPKRAQALPKYLTETEAKRLLGAAMGNPRAHSIVAILLYSGLRVGELVRLETHNVDFDELTITVKSGKGDKDRLVVVTDACMGAVREWLARRPKSPSDYVYPGRGGRSPLSEQTVQRLVQRTSKRAGIEKNVTPHVLRHTLATALLRNGGDIRFIQRMLGHASIATTQIYTHLDDAELKRMYQAAKPNF